MQFVNAFIVDSSCKIITSSKDNLAQFFNVFCDSTEDKSGLYPLLSLVNPYGSTQFTKDMIKEFLEELKKITSLKNYSEYKNLYSLLSEFTGKIKEDHLIEIVGD